MERREDVKTMWAVRDESSSGEQRTKLLHQVQTPCLVLQTNSFVARGKKIEIKMIPGVDHGSLSQRRRQRGAFPPPACPPLRGNDENLVNDERMQSWGMLGKHDLVFRVCYPPPSRDSAATLQDR